MQFSYVKWAVDDHVLTLHMDRPPVNAVNQQMYGELTTFFRNVTEFEPEARVIVLTGAGRHFCAGNDLVEFQTLSPENSDARMAKVRDAFFSIQDCALPVIGAVRGAAVGTGLAIAASCDFVVAAQDAKFGTPEVSVGIMGAARHLMRLLPQPVVRWMYLSAEPVTGAQLAALGGALEAVAAADVLEIAQDRARSIARHSPVVVGYAKRALNQVEWIELQAGYKLEQSMTTVLSGSPDSREARRAAQEKREPRFG